MYIVYVHIAPNNKKYFGITSTSPKQRWGSDGSGYKTQQLFWRAIQKYGWDNFKHIIIVKNVSKEFACQLEQLLIKEYETTNPNNGYNVYMGGEVGAKGVKFSEEVREKARQRNLGRKLSDETKKKISDANKGKKHSEEHNLKVSAAHKGKKLSDEHRHNLSIAHLGQRHSEESCKRQGKSLQTYCKNLSDEEMKKRMERLVNASKQKVNLYEGDVFICTFSSSKECAEYLNISPSMVCLIIKGNRQYRNYKIYKS